MLHVNRSKPTDHELVQILELVYSNEASDQDYEEQHGRQPVAEKPSVRPNLKANHF